jgi:hypothetical protein
VEHTTGTKSEEKAKVQNVWSFILEQKIEQKERKKRKKSDDGAQNRTLAYMTSYYTTIS